MKKVEIKWIDSQAGPAGWEHKDDLDDYDPLPVITSVGYVFKETGKYVMLVQSTGGNQITGRLSIPRVAIKKMKWMR